MKVYRYWARAEAEVPDEGWRMVCLGGSNLNEEDARREADRRAKAAAERFTGGNEAHYPYADRPLREELKEESRQGERLVAAITRNAYGSLVLNTSQVMFLDFDFPPMGFLDRIKRFFGKGADPEAEFSDKIIAQCEREPNLGLRLYRTAGGLRGLATNRLFDPAAPDTLELLERFGCDPLYIRLCKTQECFRARLTPKPWRCGACPPPSRFPWQDREEEEHYREWEREYERQTQTHAVCRLIGEYGAKNVHPEARQVIQLHDRYACSSATGLA